MIIYPAIDIRGGRCVRLLQGRADQETAYYEDPADAGRLWREAGSAWVHVVDLDGAFDGVPRNLDAVRRIAALGLRVQLGGGLRDAAAVRAALDAGAERVVVGTRACGDRDFLAALVAAHGEAVAVGIDAKDGKVAVRGWVDTTAVDAFALAAEVASLGVRTLIYTDISRDGMLTGPNFDGQLALARSVPGVAVIASGGVSALGDIVRFKSLHDTQSNLHGVIIGKALYEGRLSLAEALAAAS